MTCKERGKDSTDATGDHYYLFVMINNTNKTNNTNTNTNNN